MRSRVIVPVHSGGQILGLLDLHNARPSHRSRVELDGLRLLADQLGISLRNWPDTSNGTTIVTGDRRA